MAQSVLADAQISAAKLLRPYNNFEGQYGGQSANRQIMLTEVLQGPGGAPLDPEAPRFPASSPENNGISPRLVRGLSVPLGARVLFWFPKIVPLIASGETEIRYRWTLQWRLRNVVDYAGPSKKPYHWTRSEGIADNNYSGTPPRRAIPVANQTLVFNPSTEPTGAQDTVASNLRIEDVTSGGIYPGAQLGLPIMPDGTVGEIQQGMMDGFAFNPTAYAAFFQWHECQAVGDELVIGLWRTNPGSHANWDFTQPGGTDAQVRIFLGLGNSAGNTTPNIGVYAMWGVSP